MFRKILFGKIEKSYQDEVKRLKEKVNNLVDGRANPIEVVKDVMKDDIKFYNYKELKPDERMNYFKSAQAALNNQAVQNEVKHIYTDLVQHIATKSFNYDQVRDLRMTINGVKILIDRLNEVSSGEREKTKEDIYSSI